MRRRMNQRISMMEGVAFIGFLVGVTGVASGTLMAVLSDNVNILAGGSFLVATMTGFGLMWRSMSSQVHEIRLDLRACKRDHAMSEWRFGILLGILRREGIDVPVAVWQDHLPDDDTFPGAPV